MREEAAREIRRAITGIAQLHFNFNFNELNVFYTQIMNDKHKYCIWRLCRKLDCSVFCCSFFHRLSEYYQQSVTFFFYYFLFLLLKDFSYKTNNKDKLIHTFKGKQKGSQVCSTQALMSRRWLCKANSVYMQVYLASETETELMFWWSFTDF